MKAIIVKAVGSPANLELAEIAVPSTKDDEVLVKVKAISINPVDAFARRNQDSLNYVLQLKGDEKHIILGWDIAGIVTEAGPAVTRFKVGDEVFGMIKFVGQANGYAEYVAAPENDLALKPGNISFEEAAGVGIAALTAWQSIVTGGKIKKGDKVVITGASGGVGHYAVQFAKHFGAYVVAVTSGGNRDFVRGLGADEFIDYQTQAFEKLITDADIVHDAVWSDDVHHIKRSLRAIKPGGTLLSLIADFDDEISKQLKSKNVTGYRVLVHKSEEDLAAIVELLAKGIIKTHVSQTFPLEEMAKAHSLIETKNAVGKIIITV
jgi:NADPH:quinone reductase-like Zn-dependent oxidoreductase